MFLKPSTGDSCAECALHGSVEACLRLIHIDRRCQTPADRVVWIQADATDAQARIVLHTAGAASSTPLTTWPAPCQSAAKACVRPA